MVTVEEKRNLARKLVSSLPLRRNPDKVGTKETDVEVLNLAIEIAKQREEETRGRPESIGYKTIQQALARQKGQINKARTAGKTLQEVRTAELTSTARARSERGRTEREEEQEEEITIQEFRRRERERFVARGESRQASEEERAAAIKGVIERGEARTAEGRRIGYVQATNIAFGVTGKPEISTEERIRKTAQEQDAFGEFVRTKREAQTPKDKDAFSLTAAEKTRFLSPVTEVEKPSFYQKAYSYFSGRSTLGVSDVENLPIVVGSSLGAAGLAFRLTPAITQSGQVASLTRSASFASKGVKSFLSPVRTNYLSTLTRAGAYGIAATAAFSIAGRTLTEQAGKVAGSELNTAQTRNILTKVREAEGLAVQQAYPDNVNIPLINDGIRIPKPTDPLSEIAGARETRIQAGRATIGAELTRLGFKGEDFTREFNILTAQRGGYAASLAGGSTVGFGVGEVTGQLLQTGLKGVRTGTVGGLTALGIGARQGFFRVGGGRRSRISRNRCKFTNTNR